MSDTCNCCCKCADLNGSLNIDHNFAKKLLVAISVVVLLSMCVMPAQARSVKEHRMRHKLASAAETKDLMMMPNSETKTHLSLQKKNTNKAYREATTLILKQIKHATRCFEAIKNNLSDYTIFNRGKPNWLPRTNYKVVHFKIYPKHDLAKHKYEFVMPRVLKSLIMYERIFSTLLRAEMHPFDAKSDLYREYRQEYLKRTLYRISTIITTINDQFLLFEIQTPVFADNKSKLQSLLDVPFPQNLIRNDYVAIRGYGKTINNWYCELHPGKPSKKKCVRYIKRLNSTHTANYDNNP